MRRAGEGFAPGFFAPGAPPGFPLQEMTNPVAQLTLELSRKDQRVGSSRLIACLIVHLRRCGEGNHTEIRSYRYQPRRFGKGIHTSRHHLLAEAAEVSVGDTRQLILDHVHCEPSISLPSHARFVSRQAECPVWTGRSRGSVCLAWAHSRYHHARANDCFRDRRPCSLMPCSDAEQRPE